MKELNLNWSGQPLLRRLAETDQEYAATGQCRNDAGLRILWVKMSGLYPPNTGGRLRSFHIISELSKRHEVTVLTTHPPAENPVLQKQHLPDCKQVISIPFAACKYNSIGFPFMLAKSWFSNLPVDMYKYRWSRIKDEVANQLENADYDICIADFLFAVANIPARIGIPMVYFSHNVEFMIWRRLYQNESNPVKKSLLAIEWKKMRKYESGVCREGAMTIAVSEQDRRLLGEQAPGARIRTIPTGVDIEYFSPSPDTSPVKPCELVFTGSMDWHPNEDAILFFIESVLPLIRESLPGVTLTVVGRNPGNRLITAAANAGVRVTGTVDDIRPYVQQAALYVVPLRIGGGTRLKIFEALSMGKAVVSTTVGAEGLPLEEGKHIVRADTADSFATQVIALLKDRDRCLSLGNAGRQLMEEKFSWARVTDEFETRCKEVLGYGRP